MEAGSGPPAECGWCSLPRRVRSSGTQHSPAPLVVVTAACHYVAWAGVKGCTLDVAPSSNWKAGRRRLLVAALSWPFAAAARWPQNAWAECRQEAATRDRGGVQGWGGGGPRRVQRQGRGWLLARGSERGWGRILRSIRMERAPKGWPSSAPQSQGYPDGSKAYKVILDDGKVVKARSVVFAETDET